MQRSYSLQFWLLYSLPWNLFDWNGCIPQTESQGTRGGGLRKLGPMTALSWKFESRCRRVDAIQPYICWARLCVRRVQHCRDTYRVEYVLVVHVVVHEWQPRARVPMYEKQLFSPKYNVYLFGVSFSQPNTTFFPAEALPGHATFTKKKANVITDPSFLSTLRAICERLRECARPQFVASSRRSGRLCRAGPFLRLYPEHFREISHCFLS